MILAASAALCFSAISSNALEPIYVTLSPGLNCLTNGITYTPTNAASSFVGVYTETGVGVNLFVAGLATNTTGTATVNVATSIAGSSTGTASVIPLTVTLNGTNTVSLYSNLPPALIANGRFFHIVSGTTTSTNGGFTVLSIPVSWIKH